MKSLILIITFSFIFLSCAKKDEEETTNTSTLYTCTGTSSGSGPTIGSVALEEATYLSTCFSGMKIQLEFKNSKKHSIPIIHTVILHVQELLQIL